MIVCCFFSRRVTGEISGRETYGSYGPAAKEFDSTGKEIAEWFGKRAARYTVRFKNTMGAQDIISSIIEEYTSLIKSISSRYRTEVQGLIQRSVQEGRDIDFLTVELEKRYGITRRRAELIAGTGITKRRKP